MPRPSSPAVTSLSLFAAGLVSASCLAGVWFWYQISQTFETRHQTRVTLLLWHQVYSELKDAETSMRGFVITGDPSYLTHFDRAKSRLPRLLLDVTAAEKKVEGGLRIRRIEEAQKRIQAFLGATEETITVAEREGSEPAVALLKQGEENDRMGAVREVVDNRLEALDRRLRGLDSLTESQLRVGGRALLVLVGAAFAACAASAAALRHAVLQRRRGQQLGQDKLDADKANRAKSVFLATMSHEIRTPMNTILGFGDLLLADARDEKQTRYATSIVTSGQALLQLINDILDFSKIEAGLMEIAAEPIDVRHLADFTVQLFAHQCDEKGVQLKAEVEVGVPHSLMLDAPKVRQILINLVGNAVKFTDSGAVLLKFRSHLVEEPGNICSLTIEVSDTGPGIPAQNLDHIFEPFVQVQADREGELRGTGLGLSIVRRLATLMGGSVSVRSEEGRGSTFTVELPELLISARLARDATAPESEVDFNSLQPAVILVVDDNAGNLSVMKGFFEESHHRIATATNGVEALTWLENHEHPDIVLMDIRMPVMDGRAALAEIRKQPDLSLLPIVAVTASSLAQEEGELRAMFDGYVRKPFTRAQLFAELAQFIPACATDETPESRDEDPAPSTWKRLGERLRELEKTEWRSVCDGMVMSEISSFASELHRLAREAGCPPLEGMAQRISQEAESFSLAALEKSLAEFPHLVADIERRSSAPSS